MPSSRIASRSQRARESGWLITLLGVAVLVAGGFALGLIAGVVSEEPELVAGHLAGRSESIDWAGDAASLTEGGGTAAPGIHLPSVSAAPEGEGAEELPILGSGKPVTPTVAPGAAAPAASVPAPAPAEPLRTAAAPAAVAAAPAPRPGTGFSIQVGAFGKSAAAVSMADDLRSKGYPVLVVPAADGADQRWRVRVGPVATRSEATRLASKLKSQEELPTWVLSEEGG